jgi:Zn-dependent M16 (insulinase) family peptidase
MARRSLATYLNALTYPDRTIYPASSAVEADYFNLMSIYGDAVFFPLLEEATLRQEGHRLEFGKDGRLALAGVVYNEMRGDYSSADSLTSTRTVQSLFEEGHPYSYDSGGDPERIPELSYEAFVGFWARNYRPSNCRIFLYGNIDTAKQLAFLHNNFLSRPNPRREAFSDPDRGAASLEPVEDVPLALHRSEARRLEIPCPPEAGSEGTTSIIVNWLLPPLDKPGDALAAEFLAELLVGHEGAPLAVALRKSGLGEDISPQSGLDTNFREPIFSIGLRGSEAGKEAAIEDLILGTIGHFAEAGPDADELDAAFHSIAFANREIRRGNGTFGTRLMSRVFRTWIRGGRPEEGLSFVLPLQNLKEQIDSDPGFIPGLLRRFLLDNPHRTTVTARPDAAEYERIEGLRLGGLKKLEEGLSLAERDSIVEASRLLDERQTLPDPPEKLALLPRLRARDIPRTIDLVPREKPLLGDLAVSVHPLFTNDIVYLDLAFPLDHLPANAYLWLPLLSRFISGAGLPGLSYDRTAALLARFSGGFGVVLDSGSGFARPDGGPESGGRAPATQASYAIFRLKALAERFPKALELALGLITGADSGDEKRVADILSELGNDVTSALVPSGNSFALARAGAFWGRSLAIDDQWRGMGQFGFLKRLRAEEGKKSLGAALDGLRSSIVARKGLALNLTASREDLGPALASLETALGRLPATASALPPLPGVYELPARDEAYAIPTQVGFSAAACPSTRLGRSEYAHETVLAHLLTTGRLWDELRVKRGAYGASCYLEALEGVAFFSTYRDPSPSESLVFFGQALGDLSKPGSLDEAIVEEAVVGSAGRDLKPLLPEERGFADFRRELYGIDDELRRAKRIALLETGPRDVEKAAERLAASYEEASSVLISKPEDVQLHSRRRPAARSVDLSL